MDPFSHALLGAAAGAATTRRYVRGGALAGAVAALLPDADVLIGSADDPLLALEYHRDFSHSFVAAPAVALLGAVVAWLVLRRRVPLAAAYLAALAGVASAILLDACTSYGTRLLWPFSDERHAFSIVAVVDPLVTLALAAGVVLAVKARSAVKARLTVAVVLAYLGVGWVQHQRAQRAVLEVASARGHDVERQEVKPTLGNLLLWRSVYEAGGRYLVDAVRVGPFSAPVLYPGGAVPRLDVPAELPASSVQARDVARFARESEGYLVRHPLQADLVGDIRYAMLPDSLLPLWGLRIDAQRAHTHAEFVTLRTFSAADRERFFAMLLGRDRPR